MSQQPASPEPHADVPVWDLPLRVFHWALVALVSAAIATGLAGGAWMSWHARAGQGIAALLVFRLGWGLWGTRYARFAQFWPSPRRVWAYLRGRWQGLGHNPLGALSVFAVLTLLLTQVATGLFGNDEIGFAGPWSGWVDEELSLKLTGWHKLAAKLLYVWLGLHLAAIAIYVAIRRQPLLRAMWRGRRPGAAAAAAERPRLAWVLLSLALAAAAWSLLRVSGLG
ncbi:cytochrome b [Pelomonas saccharophila]|uniref:Cytochrome b n=1 Tax=Roseateles saccharophilus TaxID=304 RepID=A0ABU1YUW6_ROSSA|nr:cytochrome b/b6 domain-containing protein [Roseateles saccharophilus]MDR7272665.1 cytochrome b [Roseateles saccharophilus]